MNEYSMRYDRIIPCANCGNTLRAMEMTNEDSEKFPKLNFCCVACLDEYELAHAKADETTYCENCEDDILPDQEILGESKYGDLFFCCLDCQTSYNVGRAEYACEGDR